MPLISIPPPVLIEKSVTENGEYIAATDNADGYSSVKVEVPSAPTPETFEVEMTMSFASSASETTGTISSNKTYSETYAAIENGNKIEGTVTITVDSNTLPLTLKYAFNNNISGLDVITLIGIVPDGNVMWILWAGDNTSAILRKDGYNFLIPPQM